MELIRPGFVQPQEIASWYGRSRILLFPTRLDPWGVVANEALATGTPVITTPEAGVAGDLVIDAVNGYVIPPDPERWSGQATRLLRDGGLWRQVSDAASDSVKPFNFDIASQGIVKACEHALSRANR